MLGARRVFPWLASTSLCVACGEDPAPEPSAPIVVVTFNTGTTPGMGHDSPPDDGYTSGHATLSDEYYGNGLAWQAVVDDTREFLSEVSPDLVGFQELFWSPECSNIPPAAFPGFVCETWQPGDPTVAQVILGAGYQVACHQGKADKCLAVKLAFGRFKGCDSDLCLDFLEGAEVAGCGSGSRVGRGEIELTGGGTLSVVNIHGTSGLKLSDTTCRVDQFRAVFEGLDGPALARGERNIVLGDLNTDPGRADSFDQSAQKWNEHVGDGKRFRFITEVGPDAMPTYGGNFNIDHVVSDAHVGSCIHPGASDGVAPVSATVYFDHKPAVCTVRLR